VPNIGRVPLAQLGSENVSVRRSGRQGQLSTQKTEVDNTVLDVPQSGAWLNDAAVYLRETCARLPMGLEMVNEYLDFEKAMNYPSKVSVVQTVNHIVSYYQ
jgi:hypothetical protein